MMRLFYSVFLFVALATTAQAAEFKPFEGPLPIAVMVETNPWLMVIGSDTPSFVLYEDGQVVYINRSSDQTPIYMTKHLSEAEFTALKSKLSGFVSRVHAKRFINLAPGVTDQPATRFYIKIDGKSLVTSVYGLTEQDISGVHDSGAAPSEKSGLLQEQLRGLQSLISHLAFSDASEWVPKYVEVMLWDYGYAPDKSVHWPKHWPDLNSSTSIKRGDSYSIFLPGAERTRLNEFLSTRKEKGAIEIDGKKWAASVRSTFPSEPVWSKAFREKD
jgi:hypothetical protein